MGIGSNIYNALFRRNTAMLGTVFVSAFAIQMFFDSTTDKMWDALNRGRQWRDIKSKYLESAEDEE